MLTVLEPPGHSFHDLPGSRPAVVLVAGSGGVLVNTPHCTPALRPALAQLGAANCVLTRAVWARPMPPRCAAARLNTIAYGAESLSAALMSCSTAGNDFRAIDSLPIYGQASCALRLRAGWLERVAQADDIHMRTGCPVRSVCGACGSSTHSPASSNLLRAAPVAVPAWQ